MPTPDHDLAGGRSTTDPLLGFTAEGITLENILGDAASSRTYLGRTVDGQAVQVWVVAEHLARDVAFLARLHHEAQQLATLRHVHVENCLGQRTWSGPGGRPLVVLLSECSAGVVLAELAPREPLPVRDVLRVFQQACAGLAAAHRMGIVHGDVTPDALLVTTGGAAKLRAFALGVSGFAAESVGHRLIGSPDFMAPEVGRGQQPSQLSDLYGIGAALMTVLTGEVPFPAATALEAIHLNGSAPVPDLAISHPEFAQLAPLIARLMAKDPAQRWMDADDLSRELLVLSSQVAGDLRCRAWKRRRPMPLATRVQTALVQRPDLQPATLPSLSSSPPAREPTSGGTTTISRKSVDYFRNPEMFKPAVATPAVGSPILPPAVPPASGDPAIPQSEVPSSARTGGPVSSAPSSAVSTASPPRTASYLSQLAAKTSAPVVPPVATVPPSARPRHAGAWILAGLVVIVIAITAVLVAPRAQTNRPATAAAAAISPPTPPDVADVVGERITSIRALAQRDPAAALAQADALRRDAPTADLARLPVALRLTVRGPVATTLLVTRDGKPMVVSADGLMCRMRGEALSLHIAAPGYRAQAVQIPGSDDDVLAREVVLLDEPRWALPAFAPTWVKLLPAPDGVLLASDRKVVVLSSTDGRELRRLDRAASPLLPEHPTWAAVLSSGPDQVRLSLSGGLCIEAGSAGLTPVREVHRGQSSVLALQLLPLTLRLGEEGLFLVERDAAGFVVAVDNRERRLWSRPLTGGVVPWFHGQGDHVLVVGEREVERLSQEGERQGLWPLAHSRTGEPLVVGRSALLVPTAGGLVRVERGGAMQAPGEARSVSACAGDATLAVAAMGADLMAWRLVDDEATAGWAKKQVVPAPQRIVHLAIGDGRIAAVDDGGGVHLFDREGTVLRTIRPGAPLLAPPLIHGMGIVVVIAPGVVAAY